ncbi:arsenosugar biosynthesis radical SAM (seleno)protein ArsS [Cyanobacterium sp. Dongsha4]|uniref:arsenosugar biosynthesis radical SAM (seleno)protein ArsS n=1 Tax=Cyanobacterium sp. DS4 TaxID=2878255 RepID=UPI002E80E0A3|nr:arsenosugar biosynthesis radical SAM (seleno)protein ArsS [Cyanobacterium sp. Dongsha4]WVL00563.1 arsenosugar biosynthesis radical SAM protein ArsS [Cyanobacterium sp. Dongsha4]
MSFPNHILNFSERINHNLPKEKISVLQINLGRKCNLSCTHCHVEASPKRTEELNEIACQKILKIIELFPQIKTVDLTGGAPEMNYGFAEIVKVARKLNKEVIVRTNLTIFFENNYEYLPEYFTNNQLRVVASLPCYLEDNVDKQRGNGVYNQSVLALQKLNQLGYGYDPNLILDLVYNPILPQEKKFNLTPRQDNLEQDYKKYLKDNFQIKFNNLFTITNLPIGRTKFYLDKFNLTQDYLRFLEANFNSATLPFLMCRNQLSIDYLGNIYDCDFNQMSSLNAVNHLGKKLTLDDILDSNSLDLISQIRTEDYCYGCTAGSGSSCGGALL